jgi:polyferredoxin
MGSCGTLLAASNREQVEMVQYKRARTTLYLFLIMVAIIGLSIFSNLKWGAKSERTQIPGPLIIEYGMTVSQFGEANGFSNPMLKQIFSLQSRSELDHQISVYGSADDIKSLVTKKMALFAEESSKNWKKIAIKFLLWFLLLLSVYFYLKKRRVTPRLRTLLLFTSVFVFGVALGSDPSPMGTVKDAVYLFAASRAVFPPRMIALTVFLLLVFIVNKYICAWGCQAGTLQDLFFRLNRDDRQKAVIWNQFKAPFWITNSFRIALFSAFSITAFLWSFDLIGKIDFFKIYSPLHLGITGGVFAAAILLLSLFLYRPWCHLFCPFGLAGWIVEKISLVKISVNYDTCIACQRCANACPSTVMSAILLRDRKTIPDCFSCYTCRDVCPSGSIEFSTRKRTKPPLGHFEKKNKTV